MMRLLKRLWRRIEKTAAWLIGFLRAKILLPIHHLMNIPLRDPSRFARRLPIIERREFSQNGEDGIVEAIFAMIGTTNKFCVEFGVEDGQECNTRYLTQKKGWRALLMDGEHENAEINLKRAFITAENIESLFDQYMVPPAFDLLSIDIDGNDYWVWKSIRQYRPRVVIVEYNACFPWEESKTVPYDPSFRWDKTAYYGATLQALVLLGNAKGYTLIATDPCGVNAFFVRNDLMEGSFVRQAPADLYRPASFKGKPGNAHRSDRQGRSWMTVHTAKESPDGVEEIFEKR